MLDNESRCEVPEETKGQYIAPKGMSRTYTIRGTVTC